VLATIIALMMGWRKVFAQQRTANRAMRQAISSVCVLGRRTIARSYLVRENPGDWSSEYKLHARSKWQADKLFEPILKEAIALCPGKFIPIGCDDTRKQKTGKQIGSAHWGKDPLSPPFRVNLQYGLRYLHAAVLLPLAAQYQVSARALPVYFAEAPVVKKPGKKASEQQKQDYRAASKQQNLPLQALKMFQQMRQQADELGARDQIIAWAVDGSYCNATIFKADLERAIVIARTRKDAKLCWPASSGRSRYGKEKFTPEDVRKDESIDWQSTRIFHGGQWRTVYYKELNQLLWQRGGGEKRLRLLVVRPTPYRKTKRGRLLYRQPAFLLTTDTVSAASELLQIYFDRWQLEVAHKELKDDLGVGQAQVRVPASVARQPALLVATYSAMYLAALKNYGVHRTDDFAPLPRYQRDKARVSCRDLIRKLRDEVVHNSAVLPFDLKISADSLLKAASC
jgi:hypothetical protein